MANEALPQTSNDVMREFRFAIVLYGGVSLAIYMNGIAQELLHLVRSTARKDWDQGESQFRFSDEELSGTEKVYREVARRLLPSTSGNHVRFIVDIISGTSAGGINGVFLSKALANGEAITKLTDLWIEQGDIGLLLNDKKSTKNASGVADPTHPASLLNSERMYADLLDAMDGMDSAPCPATAVKELVEELDLFVTTTDIQGRVVPLRTYDRLTYERQYKYAFNFRFSRPGLLPSPPSAGISRPADAAGAGVTHLTQAAGQTGTVIGGRNDFKKNTNLFLAFAARCTSSFPFAFEPMRIESARKLLSRRGDGRNTDVNWQLWENSFFSPAHHREDLPIPIERRSFGDGGYLNNKPFSYAIDALAEHSSDIPGTRVLLYVDPDPEHPELEAMASGPPDAIQNSYDALMKLPDAQPIREDLLRINERNRLLRKVEDVIRGVTWSLNQSPAPSNPLDASSVTDIMRSSSGLTWGSYLLLRVADVTDHFSEIISKLSGLDRESSYFFAIRCLVRAWREENYRYGEMVDLGSSPRTPPNQPARGSYMNFLHDFDLWYEMRCLTFLASQVDAACQHPINTEVSQEEQARHWDSSKMGAGLKKEIDAAFRNCRAVLRNLQTDDDLKEQVKKIAGVQVASSRRTILDYVLGVSSAHSTSHRLVPDQAENAQDEYAERARELIQGSVRTYPPVEQLMGNLANSIKIKISAVAALSSLPNRFSGLATGLHPLVQNVCNLHQKVEEYDAAIFPILYQTDIGDLNRMEIIRMSPEDATSILDENLQNKKKLKGIWLGHFGSFLDRDWRKTDILWGRLDAAERLIRALLPNAQLAASTSQGKTLVSMSVDELVENATDSILAEYLIAEQKRKDGRDDAKKTADGAGQRANATAAG